MEYNKNEPEEYVDFLYKTYNIIFLETLTGFGKEFFITKNIVNDLVKNKKTCVIISGAVFQNKEMNNLVYSHIRKRDLIENRSINEIILKNGSSITFMCGDELQKYLYSHISYDVVYYSPFGIKLNVLHVLYNSLPYIKKLIISDGGDTDRFKSFREQLKKDNIKFTNRHINNINDFLLEIRSMKIFKIRSKCTV